MSYLKATCCSGSCDSRERRAGGCQRDKVVLALLLNVVIVNVELRVAEVVVKIAVDVPEKLEAVMLLAAVLVPVVSKVVLLYVAVLGVRAARFLS